MSEFFDVFLRSVFIENLALAYFLGMCTFLAVSKQVKTTLGLGVAVIVVETLSVPINNLIYNHLLRQGALDWAGLAELDFAFLGLLTQIAVIAAMIQLLEIILDRFFPALYETLGIFLPLLTVNCAILGASLFMVQRDYGFVESVAYGLGAGVGWALAIIALAGLREKMRYSDIPDGLQGLGITFVTTGLLSLAFMGISGIIW
ncbi:MAG: NADH:ubiquinone reductase (Na(+)-transporting) subunit E [Xanthomonadales bacterium]|nr:NADH:ubiquinone reductase (Na(+)-transporting) subunit E [Gammaproteobacteria bacterium]MBT8051619.1 NADH:ubiquinone reductase (Na(+)-transporting) subunit E [Gammaproteobacteria bacterium]MBT8055491.1 NADH:ubiquinone reductase (Na(+)-transporting) subunit E [Gammaproteobacteria bacterium]NNJ77724.1 NADH:ubiquinone reductase (Na(+)-transporting) subunit E [Xanthomonadales bacterium]NNL04927.1 NADH:ubiquinone reductase (Na(+)-transporting) subunit E [Xanthomonadales bacterium]